MLREGADPRAVGGGSADLPAVRQSARNTGT